MVSFVFHVTLSKVHWFTSDREKKYGFSVFVIVRHHFGILRFLSSSLLEGTAATKMAATRFCRFIVPSTSVKVTTKVFGKTGIFNLARQIYVRFHLWLIVFLFFIFCVLSLSNKCPGWTVLKMMWPRCRFQVYGNVHSLQRWVTSLNQLEINSWFFYTSLASCFELYVVHKQHAC